MAWTTEYYGLAVDSMRDEVLAHISPTHSENINFLSIDVDIEGERAQLGPTRLPATAGARHPVLIPGQQGR